MLGAAVFVAANILAALAQTGDLLIAARAVQGVGGAMMLPTSLSLLNAGFRGRERGLAFAFWGATIGGTAALGPLLGGWLTTSFSWRWAFGINLPIGLAVIIGIGLLITESKEERGRPGVDWIGAVLAAIGFGGVVFGLIEGRAQGWLTSTADTTFFGLDWPWTVSPVPISIVIGVAGLVALIMVERRRNRLDLPSMIDLSLFAIPSFRNGNLAAAIVSLGEFGIIFSLPLWFQNVAGFTAFQTGLALLPLAVGSFAASGLQAALFRDRSPLLLVRIGIALEIIGIAGIALLLRTGSGWLTTSPLLLVYGLGVGMATAQLTGVVLADVPVAKSGQGRAPRARRARSARRWGSPSSGPPCSRCSTTG